MKKCLSCGTNTDNNAKRCPSCGATNFDVKSGDEKNVTIPNKQEPATVADDDERFYLIDVNDHRNDILLKTARPDVYRINAFRILEMPVTATPQEISNYLHRQEILEQLDETSRSDKSFLSLIPTPDSDSRKEAERRLSNPENRLIDELFWFWPLEAGVKDTEDKAIMALKRNDYNTAIDIWKHREETNSEANVSMHNLAILYHMLALDIEYFNANNLTAKQTRQKWDYWKQAFSRWQTLMNHEAFWSRLTKRIPELKDARLTTGIVRRFRSGLPFIILSINADIAIWAMEKGNEEEASHHVEMIKNSGFGKKAIEMAMNRAAQPVRDRINICCDNAVKEVTNESANCRDIVNMLIEQSSRLLKMLDILLPASHLLRESSHDTVASAIFDLVIASTKRNKKWDEALDMLGFALKISIGSTMRKRIEDNIKTAQENQELDLCWFCKTNNPDEGSKLKVEMFGDVNYNNTNVTWHHLTIEVPRCKQCKSAQSSSSNWGCLGLVIGACLGILTGINTNILMGFIVFGVCTAIGFGVPAALKPKGVKPESYYKEFSSVKELLAKGWDFGDKPSGVQ